MIPRYESVSLTIEPFQVVFLKSIYNFAMNVNQRQFLFKLSNDVSLQNIAKSIHQNKNNILTFMLQFHTLQSTKA